MAWLNASGSQIGYTPLTIQIDIPAEPVGNQAHTLASVRWGGVLSAAIQLVIAMMTGNPTAIANAIQALLAAFMGA